MSPSITIGIVRGIGESVFNRGLGILGGGEDDGSLGVDTLVVGGGVGGEDDGSLGVGTLVVGGEDDGSLGVGTLGVGGVDTFFRRPRRDVVVDFVFIFTQRFVIGFLYCFSVQSLRQRNILRVLSTYLDLLGEHFFTHRFVRGFNSLFVGHSLFINIVDIQTIYNIKIFESIAYAIRSGDSFIF